MGTGARPPTGLNIVWRGAAYISDGALAGRRPRRFFIAGAGSGAATLTEAFRFLRVVAAFALSLAAASFILPFATLNSSLIIAMAALATAEREVSGTDSRAVMKACVTGRLPRGAREDLVSDMAIAAVRLL